MLENPKQIDADSPMWVLNLFTCSGMTKSNGDARALLKQGSLYINGDNVPCSGEFPSSKVTSRQFVLLQVGKHRRVLLRVWELE